MSQQKLVKLFLLGDPESGKNAILDVFRGENFPSKYKATVGPDFITKDITVESTSLTLQTWHGSGQERFNHMAVAFYRGVESVGIVLDGTRPVREQIDRWVNHIRSNNPEGPIHFVVNKTDSDKYKEAECKKAIDEWKRANPDTKNQDAEGNPADIPVFYCSAKNNKGITEAFQGMGAGALSHLKRTKPDLFQPKKNQEHLQGGGSPGGGSPSLLEGLIETLKEHRWWAGVNGFLIAAVIVLLILTAVFPPVGAALAVGGLSGLAMAGIIGGGALMLWNALCGIGNVIENVLSKRPPGGGAGGSYVPDNMGGLRASSYVSPPPGAAPGGPQGASPIGGPGQPSVRPSAPGGVEPPVEVTTPGQGKRGPGGSSITH